MTGSLENESKLHSLKRRLGEMEQIVAQLSMQDHGHDLPTVWSTLESLGLMVWATDLELNGVYFNGPWLNARARSFQEECGEGWFDAFHTVDHPSVEKLIRKTGSNEVSRKMACRFKLGEGDYASVELMSLPRYDTSGNHIGYCGYARMSSEQSRSQSDIEIKFRHLVDNIEDAILISQDGKFVLFNRRFPSLLGYTSKDLRKLSCDDIFTTQGMELLYEREALRRQGLPVSNSYQTSFRKKNGDEISVDISVNIIDYRGLPASFSIIRDITERRKIEFERNVLALFGLKLSGVTNLKQIVNVLREATEDLFKWDALTMSIRQPGRSCYRKFYCIDIIDGKKQEFHGEELASWSFQELHDAIKDGKGIVEQRTAKENSTNFVLVGNKECYSRSIIQTGILDRGRVVAILGLHSYTENHYDQVDADLLNAMGNQLRSTLMRCFAENRLRALSDLGKTLSESKTPIRVAEALLNAADSMIGWDASSINHYFTDSQKTDPILSYDMVNEKRCRFIMEGSKGPASAIQLEVAKNGAILLDGQTFIDSYAETSYPFGDTDRRSQSLMFAPMRTKGKACVGVITIQSYTANAYDKEDLQLLQVLADHGSGAMNRTRVEAELRDSERQFRLLLEASRDAIVQIALDGKIVYTNPAARLLFPSLNDREIDSSNFLSERISPEDRPSMEEVLNHISQGDRLDGLDIVWEWYRKDGSLIKTENGFVSITGPRQEIVGYLLTIRDITERELFEQRRREIEERIQQSQRLESISLLAGGIAHDFNNLLTGILGNAELLMMDTKEEELLEPLRDIEKSARRAAELTHQMMTYAGSGDFEIRPVNLSKIIHEVRDVLKTTISPQVQLIFKLDERLPYIEADAGNIRQIVLCLVNNSNQAIGENAGKITIRSGAMFLNRDDLDIMILGSQANEGEFVYIEVEDNGCGMGAETQKRIFDPFFTRYPTRLVGSKGLQLSALSGIVKTHNGAIIVDSTKGVGTTFRVYLPVRITGENVQPKSTPDSQKITGGSSVLVVDDDIVVRKVACTKLKKHGFQIYETATEKGVMELMMNADLDLSILLLDYRIRGKRCTSTIKRIRDHRPNLPIVLMISTSDYIEPILLEDQHLRLFEKPFSPTALLDVISKMLS